MNDDRAEAAFWAAFIRNRNVDVTSAEDGAVAIAGGYAMFVTGTYCQLALAIGSSRALRADDLDVLTAFYARRGAATRLEVREEVLERDGDLLAAAGLEAGDLRFGLYEATEVADPQNPRVTVRSGVPRNAWVRLVTQAFADGGKPDAESRRSAEVSAAAAHGLFIADVDGVPAGAAAAAVLGEATLLFSAAVLPQFRRRGVHRALLHARAAFGAVRGASRTAVKAVEGTASQLSAQSSGFQRTTVLRRLHGPPAAI